MHISCEQGTGYDGCQSELIRIPLADGTLVATPEQPSDDLVPSLLALSDVMATGWHAAVSAGVGPGMTVAMVGDGAVGLSGVLAASQLGADRVIAMSRHAQRQQLAKEFGATDIVPERGEDGVARIKEVTDGVGADAVLECVGTGESVLQALRSTRPGGMVGSIPWSPLAKGRLARPWGEHTQRFDHDPVGQRFFGEGDRAIVDAVQKIAEARGVPMAQVALAWVLKNPVITAPIVGATKPHHLADAVAAIEIHLTDNEVRALEDPYTPRRPAGF